MTNAGFDGATLIAYNDYDSQSKIYVTDINSITILAKTFIALGVHMISMNKISGSSLVISGPWGNVWAW
jgi:hypothetical protein